MNTLFIIILAFLVFGYAVDTILDLLNLSKLQTGLPGEMEGKYDPDQYGRSQKYLRETTRFGLIASTIATVFILLCFILGAFSWLDRIAWSVSSLPVVAALVFFGLAGLAADIGSTPFAVYSTFVIEQKYGFNTTTPATFILDKLKSWLIAVVVGGPVLALVVWLYTLLGQWFWIAAWMVITLFSLLMTFFYSSLIVPLFNKQRPLEEGTLYDAIHRLSERAGFRTDKVFVIDGSKRSTKANAYFTGFGKKKRIVLYDTLIRDLSENEVLAVLAHEIGHYRLKHIVKGMATSILQTGAVLFIFSLLIDNPALANALGISEPNFHIGALVFGVLFSPVSMVLGIILNLFSRKHEYQADAYASGLGLSEFLGSALIRLAEKNLGNLTPHPAYVFVHYSHPPLLQRLNHLKPTTPNP